MPPASRRTSVRRLTRRAAALAVGITISGPAALAAAAIQTPPPGGIGLAVGVNESFIAVERTGGPLLPASMRAEVWRGGVLVASTEAGAPVGGALEFNHDGSPCFVDITPDFTPGDQIRVVDDANADNGYASIVHALDAQAPALAAPGTVVVSGTAATAAGAPLPISELDVLVREGAFLLHAPGDGTLGFIPVSSPAWTATFSGLAPADEATALGASRVELGWTRGTESQAFAVGAPGGPAPGCAAPRATAPGAPDLVAADDSGTSSTDNVTSVTQPAVSGTALVPGGDVGLQVTLIDSTSGTPVQVAGPVPVDPDGAYALIPDSPLADGAHELRVVQSVLGHSVPSAPLVMTVDSQIATPVLTSANPASGSDANTPRLRGTAEAGSNVTIHTDPGCTGVAAATGSAAGLAGLGVAVSVPDNSTTTFYARASDAAGNVSACSAPLVYQEVTPTGATGTTTATAAATAAVNTFVSVGPAPRGVVGPFTLLTQGARVLRRSDVRLRIACVGRPSTLCVGRILLRTQVRSGASSRVVTIGRKSFAVRGGRTTSVLVRLTPQGRALVAGAPAGGLRVTAQVVVRQDTVTSRRTGMPLTLFPTRTGTP